MATQYTDWEVAEAQLDQIVTGLPTGIRAPQLRKYIEGVAGKKITEQLKVGVWLKPIGSESGTTYSCVQDVRHPTLLIIAEASSTGDSYGTPLYDTYRQLIRRLFQNRRATGLDCEMYSTVQEGDYEIDERLLQRKMDIQMFVITTVIREDR